MSHVDEGRLHAFLDGALSAADPADADRVELHLAACADCRAKLDEAARLRDEAAALLGTAAPAAFEVPSFDAIRARADAIAGDEAQAAGAPAAGTSGVIHERRTRRHTRGAVFATPFNGLAWAATIVVAVGLGWLLNDTIEDPDIRPLSVSTDRARVRAEGPASDASADFAASGSPEEVDAPAVSGDAATGSAASAPPPAAPRERERPRTPQSYVGMDDRAATGAVETREAPREEMQRAAAEPAPNGAGEAARGQAAAAPPAPPPAASSLETPAGRETGEAAAATKQPQADDGWVPASLDQARRATGGELAVLDGARPTSAATRGTGSALEVRTVQRTARGEVVEVVQRTRITVAAAEQAGGSRDAVSSRAAVTQQAAPQPMAAIADGADADDAPIRSTSTVRWRDWTVTISAAVGADRLSELVAELP